MVRVAPPHEGPRIKRAVCAEIDRRRQLLLELSHAIHRRPELAYQEHFASATLADVLEAGGLRVERGALGLPTAFRATVGPNHPRTIVICCEYDALRGMGHACGHNIIAAAGVGAGLALAPFAARWRRHLTVLGTPAEEGGGGKIALAKQGAFARADAVMLVHPATEDVVTPALRAALALDVTFLGRAAHAAMAPELGRGALDAAILAYHATMAINGTVGPYERVNAVISTNAPPNVIAPNATGRFVVRAASLDAAAPIAARVVTACKAAAAAVDCRVRIEQTGDGYDSLRHNDPLAEAFVRNASRLRRRLRFGSVAEMARAGSTDLGTVSQLAPTIHPKLAIAPAAAPQHTPAFAAFAGGRQGDRAVIDGAKAMAMTVIDLWLEPGLRRSVHEAHRLSKEAA